MPRTVVVSPHLDDAVLSVYGRLDAETAVVTVCAGLPPAGVLSPWDADSGATDSRARIAERRDEDRAALGRSGARAVHLDLLDRQYVALGAAPEPTVDQVAAALRTHVEEAEVVFAPAAISTNSSSLVRRVRRRRGSDHLRVREATLLVRPDAWLYAELPYALTPDRGFVLPRDVSKRSWREHRETLADELVAEKVESFRCYSTQIEPLVELFGDFVPTGLGQEVVWEPVQRV